MEHRTRWQDWVNVVFGVWLFISPFVLGYSTTSEPAAWNSYVLGVAVTLFAIVALFAPQLWEEWINLVLGIWLIISPFLLGYAAIQAPVWNHVIMGVLIGGDSLWAMQRPHPTMA